jgi:glycine betaine catabolism B
MSSTFPATLTDKIPRTSATMSFRFSRPADYDFVAGQWFIITFPGEDGPLTHHFTHSNAPGEPFLEFTTRLTGSTFKRAMQDMAPGTEVTLEGPFGGFVLKDTIERAVFLTGGIGVTPVRSILRDLAERDDDRAVTVFYGNESEETITFADELAALERDLTNLRVHHVLSRPNPEWSGRQGHVRAEVLAEELEDRNAWHYFISGPPGMVQAMRDMLRELDVPRRQITLENFEGYE